MDVLIIGSGGREHAICRKISQSPKLGRLYCAPGNAGIADVAECVDIKAMDMEALADFAEKNAVDLTIVGMDDPLVAGIVDIFEKRGLKAFGPKKNAAVIEGSKAFSKDLMRKYNIPTANYEIFDNCESALSYVKNGKFPIVIKADGLALGKGVLIAENISDAEEALKSIMVDKKFGNSGNKVVIEEFLEGPEVSVLSFCDGENIVPMVSAQDHKRAYDGDKGLNTGGMGAFSPSKVYTKDIAEECMKKIFKPTVEALKKEGRPFVGVLYFGLMLSADGPKVIEYNCRFGDPEAEAVLLRLKTDLIDICEACIEKKLDKINIEWENNAVCCVIEASGGYPVSYEKGFEIKGLDEITDKGNIVVFHCGTAKKNGKFVTAGGRVLAITGIGKDMDEAIKAAYSGVDVVTFEKMHYRKDIGIKKY